MRDDFDPVVADRFKVLDQVPVPDTWSRVHHSRPTGAGPETHKGVLTMIDLETPVANAPRPKGRMRIVVAAVLAAAAVVAIALVAARDGGGDGLQPSDQPSTTVTVPPPPRALFGTPEEQYEPGTYFVDEVEGTPTPRISITIGDGWSNTADGWGIGTGYGFITFSQPDRVFLDACHPSEGYHLGPMTTFDGLVTALSEQQGWAEATAPAAISIDGYPGIAFQRSSPTDMSDCTRDKVPRAAGANSYYPLFPSFETVDEFRNLGWSYYFPGETETLWVLDVDGTLIILNTRVEAGQPATAHAELAAALDSIRIDRG